MMMQEQQMHLDPMAPPMSEGPPFTPPPPLAAMAGLHHHAEAHQIHGPLGGFKIEPPHMEPLRLHNGHGGPGSPTPPPPGGPPPPWPPGQTITENTASFLNSANPPPPPPPSSSGKCSTVPSLIYICVSVLLICRNSSTLRKIFSIYI